MQIYSESQRLVQGVKRECDILFNGKKLSLASNLPKVIELADTYLITLLCDDKG